MCIIFHFYSHILQSHFCRHIFTVTFLQSHFYSHIFAVTFLQSHLVIQVVILLFLCSFRFQQWQKYLLQRFAQIAFAVFITRNYWSMHKLLCQTYPVPTSYNAIMSYNALSSCLLNQLYNNKIAIRRKSFCVIPHFLTSVVRLPE